MELGVRPLLGVSGFLDSEDRRGATLWKCCEGQEGLELAGGEEIGTADQITCGGVGSNPATGEAVVEIGRFRELPDIGAKMSRGFAEARVWRSGVATAAQRTGHGGAKQGSGAGDLGGGCGGVVRTGMVAGAS